MPPPFASTFPTATTRTTPSASSPSARWPRSWGCTSAFSKICRVRRFAWGALKRVRSPWPQAMPSPSPPGRSTATKPSPPLPTTNWPRRYTMAAASCSTMAGSRWWSSMSTRPTKALSAESRLGECFQITRGSTSPMCSSPSGLSPLKIAVTSPLACNRRSTGSPSASCAIPRTCRRSGI